MEDTIKLAGWKKARRVVLLRRPIKVDLALSQQVPWQLGEQAELFFPGKDKRVWEYATLVTNSSYKPQTIAQLYRDRADAENSFDELKNQWGWDGFTTQDIGRCQSSARAVALIYNWCSWYLPGCKSERANGGDHESGAVAGGRWESGQACWANNTLFDINAWREG